MKLGILGGTFDPIHYGHLRIAEEVCEELSLDKVYLIPGALPPHKDNRPITIFHDRLAMVRMAITGSPHFEALDLEGRRTGPSYTIETLREIHHLFGPSLELFFIIGIDAFLEIKTWKSYQELFTYTHFAVLNRPGFPSEHVSALILSLGNDYRVEKQGITYKTPTGTVIGIHQVTRLDISSTKIRQLTADGKSIRFLVPESVRVYIETKELYKIDGGTR